MREGRTTPPSQPVRPYLLGAGCTSAAGDSIASTWDRILEGGSQPRRADSSRWKVQPRFEPRAFFWPNAGAQISAEQLLVGQTLKAYREAMAELTPEARARVGAGKKLGVIFATTKGVIEDHIWGQSPALERDYLTPLMDSFLVAAELNPARKVCLSNACASTLSAVALAREWLSAGGEESNSQIDDVLILAADQIGPFVLHGFHALRAVTLDVPRPFDQSRSGLLLGEATAALVLSRFPGKFAITGVSIDAEGFAITRPAESGASLKQACVEALETTEPSHKPDLIIAHGTATDINDPFEAHVFASLFPNSDVPITASKGAVGHTLATSGALDLIFAREAMKRGGVFSIPQTTHVDPKFRGKFLVSASPNSVEFVSGKFQSVLVTSLGFGGIHAAALLQSTQRQMPADSQATHHRTSLIPTPTPAPTPQIDHLEYEFPAKSPPAWAATVDRWYQLDPYAYGLAQAAHAWLKDPAPDAIILASEAGSNYTDAAFAAGGAFSPALFVHSLPSVRSSSFCQVLKWHGPLYCIQAYPEPFVAGQQEALRFCRNTGKSVWVLSIERTGQSAHNYLVHRFKVQ